MFNMQQYGLIVEQPSAVASAILAISTVLTHIVKRVAVIGY